jgi:3-methyl-2-oxobutanoate hydroxymethyltransferase
MDREEDLMRLTPPDLIVMRSREERIAMLTTYDATFARLADDAGVDVVLVGDSLGMVIQGNDTTLSVTPEHVEYHTRCVAAGAARSAILADLPFGSYQASPEHAYTSAARVMATGAQMVKMEGGAWLADTMSFLVERGIPVCAHLGLTPQSVYQLGGYKVQGRSPEAAAQLVNDARLLEQAGASMLVLELVPAALAAEVTSALSIPTIGIGAGAACSGQVLVLHDMLGISPGKPRRFVRDFTAGGAGIAAALRAYVEAVKNGTFPGPEHSF